MLNSSTIKSNPVARGALKAFDITRMLSENNPVTPVFTPATPAVEPSLASSPAWVRLSGIETRTVPYVGNGDGIAPYLGWMLAAYEIEVVEVETNEGCYLAAYAYNGVDIRSDVDSRMFLFYRENDSDGFYVMDGYSTFMPNEAVETIAAESAHYTRLDGMQALAAVNELFHRAESIPEYRIMARAWIEKKDALEYWHGADRGAWDWKS